MTDARTVRPTDLVALVAYNGRVFPNEAHTLDRIGKEASPHPLETALEQWFSFATGRHTWISVKGAAWEIDCLIDAAEDDSGVLLGLLDQVAADAGRAGAEKVFLRLASGSDVLKTACRSGFSPYLTERLMAAPGLRNGASNGSEPKQAQPSGGGLRRWSRADAYPAFRLYNLWTPVPVRQVEAATFPEWKAARERMSPPRRAHQRVMSQGGRIGGWLRTAADGELGRFELMADPSAPELLDQLIDAALARLAEQPALFTLAPDFAPGLRERLAGRGFVERGEFIVLARRTTRPVRMSELAPATGVQT